jgi:hypothetical protein
MVLSWLGTMKAAEICVGNSGSGVILRGVFAIVALAAFGTMTGCMGGDPEIPPLTPAQAAALISERWSQDELNHFRVVFHSDTLIPCGVSNGLWKLGEITDRGGNLRMSVYQLTDKGHRVMTAVGLRESGRGHEVLLKGPYRLEVTAITEGSQPNLRNVAFRWDLDWAKAPADLKVCLPRFEMSGGETAVFEYNEEGGWKFTSYQKYLNPDDNGLQQAGLPGAPLSNPQVTLPSPPPQPAN